MFEQMRHFLYMIADYRILAFNSIILFISDFLIRSKFQTTPSAGQGNTIANPLSWMDISSKPWMQCTNALPAFIISGNGVMINLIVISFSRDEVRRNRV
jgi:hypothetical protein